METTSDNICEIAAPPWGIEGGVGEQDRPDNEPFPSILQSAEDERRRALP